MEAKDREFQEQKKLWDKQFRNVMALMDQSKDQMPPQHAFR